jgi:hypothetical protein
MEHAPRYWLGLLMFCVAAVLTVALGNILQYRAVAQQATIASHSNEPLTASLLPPATRKASYFPY